jgi:hypothetical protein
MGRGHTASGGLISGYPYLDNSLENNMTTEEKVARRKLSLLELASEMQALPTACRGARGPHPNRVSEEVEQAVLAHSLQHPTQGCLRVAQEMTLQEVQF